jgi:ABC-type nitrate/sulfonate/bicarbonate transport system substrate-binding protein
MKHAANRRSAGKALLGVTLALASTYLVLGAGTAQSGPAQSGSAQVTPEKGGPPSINLPLAAWTSVALKKGFLQEEFAKIGTTQIRLLNPGTSELSGAEAAMLDRGGLAIAQRMMYPATVHRANGLDAVVVWMSGPSDENRTPILALKSSPYETLQDLKGLSLGSSRVGCGWTSPTEALEAAGVPLTTRIRQGAVRHETIVSSATVNSALLSGRIAATATHIALPAAAALVTTGQVKIIGRSPKEGVYVNAAGRVSYFAMREFVDKYPEAVKAFLVAHERTKKWIKENVDEASEIVAKELRLPVNIAKFGIVDSSSFEYMAGEQSSDQAINSIKIFQKYYIDHGDDILAEHNLSEDQINTFVDRRFFAGGAYSVY